MRDTHISQRDLLLYADGELSPEVAAEAGEHLAHCWLCRERMAEIESVSEFVREHFDTATPRAERVREPLIGWRCGFAAAAVVVVAMVGLQFTPAEGAGAPRAALTPGATRNISHEALCSTEETLRPPIAPALAMEVFHRYGIEHPLPREFEVDYLIPSDLGGSDDAANLWPQPYATGVWNSRVKDALEDRLHELVCSGAMDLKTAQREIAGGWIAAYQKYFDTERPLPDHFAFVRDRPWE